MPSNPFTILKADHRAVEELFEKILDTTERAEKTRKELFEELYAALDEHALLEETFLYPALEEAKLTHEIALEAEAEHDQVKKLLAELDAMDETTEEWTAKMTVLKENVEHHVKEEEEEMFPQSEKALSEDELDAIGESISTAKTK